MLLLIHISPLSPRCLGSAPADAFESVITCHLLRFAEVGKKFDKPEEPLKISRRSKEGATLSILTLFYGGPTMQSVAQVTALTGSVRTFYSGK